MLLLAAFLAEERTDEVVTRGLSEASFLSGFGGAGDHSARLGLSVGARRACDGDTADRRCSAKYIVAVSVLAVMTVLAAFIARLVNEYQVQRLKVFLDQETTDPGLQDAVYQVRNAINGRHWGLWGKGGSKGL